MHILLFLRVKLVYFDFKNVSWSVNRCTLL